MKNIVSTIIQVIADIIFGIASYWFFANICNLKGNIMILATLTATAIFAEVAELNFKK